MPARAMLSVGSLCNPREPAQPATALRPELGTEGGRPAPDVEQAAVTSDAESKEDASKKEEQSYLIPARSPFARPPAAAILRRR